MHQPIKYRSDIDGLRALAVLSVVFYHAEWWPFTGGYIGVDIFFVISGYLITTIIYREMQERRFSFLNFYERRIRRILPALFVVLLFCSVVAYGFLSMRQYAEFSEILVATIFFVSNFSLWSHSGGYFDSAEQLKPLLHTWSLSIEEQFYIVFPPFLLFLYFVSRKIRSICVSRAVLGTALYTVILASLGLSVATAIFGVAVKTAFFFLPFRAWELGLGAILALQLVPSLRWHHGREILSVLGLLCILIAVFGYDHGTLFPGYAALLPALGTALIIYAGTGVHSTWVGRFLGVRPLVFVGLISYSLYLWHWPLLAFMRIVNLGDMNLHKSAAMVALSLCLAVLSWRYIERPFRGKSSRLSRNKLFLMAVFISLLFVGVGGYGVWSEGRSAAGQPFYHYIYSQGESVIYNAQMEHDDFMSRRFDVFLGRGNRSHIVATIIRKICEKARFGCSGNDGMEYVIDNDAKYVSSVLSEYNPSYVLLGDSHAMYATENTLFAMAGNDFSKFYSVANSGRWPIIGVVLKSSGTSEVWDVKPVMDVILRSETIKTVIMSNRYAVHIYGGTPFDFGPAENGESFFNWIESDTGKVVFSTNMAEREELFARYFSSTVRTLLNAGKRVVIVYPVPEVGYDVPREMMRRLRAGEDVNSFYRPMDYFWKRNGFIISVMDSLGEHPNLVRIKPHEVLCDGHQCKTAVDGKPLYVDDDHLSQAGVNLLRPQLEAIFQDPNWN